MGKMKHGFFGFLGNNIAYSNIDRVFWILLVVFLGLLIMIFKTKIHNWYTKNDHKKLSITLGVIFILLNLISRIMFSISGYPRHWEIVPLQLCRITFTTLGVLLLFNRHDLVKWIVVPMILGGMIAIYTGSLNSASQAGWIDHKPIPYPSYSQGIDNYFYWDYYLTHMSLVLMGFLLWSMHKWVFSFKEILSLNGLFAILGIFIFTLNVTINWIDPDQQADYFYMGEHSSIKIWSFLGPFSKWPLSFFVYVFGAMVAYFSICLLWSLQGFWNIGEWKFYKKTTNPITKGTYKLKKHVDK
jgi:hypothetical protein